MTEDRNPAFVTFLRRHTDADWAGVVHDLLPAMHPVDYNATQIWFRFWPYDLRAALEAAPDRAKLEKRLLLQGKFYLDGQIDDSHRFFYAHGYWPQVKRAVADYAAQHDGGELAAIIHEVARGVAAEVKDEESVLLGITAVAFMTLQHVGLDAFRAAPGLVSKRHISVHSPAKILSQRAADDSQGLFGFLRTVDKRWTVVYDENRADASFTMMDAEEIASGAARDQSHDWRAQDERCIEGPIPVECRSAACGTCWVGILGGAEKLSDVSALEAKRMKVFGYLDTDEAKPLVRLACQARSGGAVSLVIPPWNGVFGKFLKRQEETEEEPAMAESVV
jgi:ferredoxin